MAANSSTRHSILLAMQPPSHRVSWRPMYLQATLLATAILASTLPTLAQTAPNTLSKQEAAQGWHLLFDGKTTEGWHSTHGPDFPPTGWEAKHALLSAPDHDGEDGRNARDTLTTRH